MQEILRSAEKTGTVLPVGGRFRARFTPRRPFRRRVFGAAGGRILVGHVSEPEKREPPFPGNAAGACGLGVALATPRLAVVRVMTIERHIRDVPGDPKARVAGAHGRRARHGEAPGGGGPGILLGEDGPARF